MKRVIAITTALLVGCSSWAAAQSTASPPSTSTSGQSIADVAKAEEARRKTVRKPAKVYTNGNLRTDVSPGVPAPPASPSSTTTTPATTPGNTTPGAPGAAAPAADGPKDQAYWSGRMKALLATRDRNQLFADSLQTRINSLLTDFINRDDPAQRAQLEAQRIAALAELEKVKKELEEQTKAIAALEDEARRAGAPPGWLRPGA
jgi:hypothetical protein